MDRSAKILADVFNSDKFKNAILQGEFTETSGLTNLPVYDLVMQAHELQGPGGTDGVVDLRVRAISREIDGKKWMRRCRPDSWAGTEGIDGSGTTFVATGRAHLASWAQDNHTEWLAAHYAHEYMHILGFSRYRKKFTSLVCQIGDIVEDLVKNGY